MQLVWNHQHVTVLYVTSVLISVQTFVRFSGVYQTVYAADEQNQNRENDDDDDENPPHISQGSLFLRP